MSNELAIREERSLAITSTQMDVIRQTICKDHNDTEIGLFLQYCRSKGMDPFARMIYSIVRVNTKGERRQTIQTGIDGMRSMAEQSGKYAGQEGPLWCGPDGAWKDIWLDKLPPVASKVGILRTDFRQPIWGIALWNEYKPDQDWMWRKMPALMLSKVAESLALRKAFPDKLSGIYTDDEMKQSERPTPIESHGHTYRTEWNGKELGDEDHVFEKGSHEYCAGCRKEWDKLTQFERDQFLGASQVPTVEPTPIPSRAPVAKQAGPLPSSGPATAKAGAISDPQRKRMFAIAKSSGWSDDAIKGELRKLGYEHSADVLKKDYDKICKLFEGGSDAYLDQSVNPDSEPSLDEINDFLPG